MTELPDNTRWQLWIVAFGFFMQSLDTTIVNTALPSMAKSLGESPLHMHLTSSPTFALRDSGGGFPLVGDG
ncbi:hypothetical protein CGD37_20280 [Salmonella enterica subsp. enterica serovar Cerro]|uniref:Uncharacterized protein n=1 Tax=Salmonella enterica subsp. enterica serovar Cerro TaxID=340188 RepID=A0A5Z6ZEM1_SALET|nr:hypothetical protein [Salmonella enterica subsp. enterica serovar Cerro]EAV8255735.1 hypothetical protein [Salmonella enterica]EBL6661904.1 hypothetical protein [Salmonella enterica subsp. enterica serovar Rough O:z4,z23:-]EDS7547942.1 hypothetical protein [Salmonella enterica subsp. enterica]EAN4862428.1 hypothetical protein [Salmonella enterica subsp. enterica serovar Cerro]